eukprot:SAG11_NODE_628_length_8077_cov_4.820632_5_plen_42_part_00
MAIAPRVINLVGSGSPILIFIWVCACEVFQTLSVNYGMNKL